MQQKREGNLLPRFSVYRPVTVAMIFMAMLVLGFIAYTRIPLEMMPSGYESPFMAVRVPYPNATPEVIQNRITRPIEEILGTVRNVKETGAMIRYDMTWIRINFAQGTDMDLAYAEVRDRMDRVMADMPEDLDRIYIRRFDMDSRAEISVPLQIQKDVPDLAYFLDHHLGRKILRLDGVANVEFEGVEEKQFEIVLSMDKLSSYRINLFEAAQLIRGNNFALPSGHVQEGDRRFYVRSDGRFQTIEDLKDIEIKPGIMLSDIADVKFHVPDQGQVSRVNAKPGVWLSIHKESGANTVDVHKAVMSVLDDEFAHNANLDGIVMGPVFSQGQLIIDSIADLQETALWAGIFAVLVLFFFLRHLRMTLVITMAIPISLMITLVLMYFTGETLNLLSLMGLMISVGLVVDNSVVVLENIFRHRRAGDSPKKAAITGAAEVALAVTMATLTTVAVFLPMILISGGSMMSFFMARLGLPVVFSLFSSLFVALVFIPLMTTLFDDKGRIGSSHTIEWVRGHYKNALRLAVNRRVETAVIAILILIFIFAMSGEIGYQGDSGPNNDTNLRFMLARKYSDLEAFPLVLSSKVEAWCEEHADMLDYDVIATRVNDDFVRISLMRRPSRQDTSMMEKPVLWVRNMFKLDDMRKDPENERRTYIKENLMEDIGILPSQAELFFGWGQGGGEESSQIKLSLIGNDYEELRKWGERVRTELKRLPGILDVDTDDESGNDELHVIIDRDRARASGVDIRVASFTVSNAVRGAQLPKFQEKDREIDVLMRLRESDRLNVQSLKNLRIPSTDGREIPLGAIARFENTRGPGSINHTNKLPNYSLTITGEDARMDALFGMVAGAMRNLGNGPDYSWKFGENRRRMQEDQGNFVFAAALAVVFVFLLMGVLFESFALPLTIISTVPFAFAGSQLLLRLYDMPANLFAYIGIIIIVGVVVNNGIVLVDLINRLRKQGIERTEAIAQAGYFRFRPILMTAGTTVFSLIPMGFGDANLIGMPYNPLGLAMIGGLALNSLLSLFLVPVFYTFFDDLKHLWGWSLGLLFGKKKEALPARGGAAANK